MSRITHPHIASDPGICGGSPIIAGTRFPVRSVVIYILRHGLTPEELVAKFSHLTLAQVHDALAYYYDYGNQGSRSGPRIYLRQVPTRERTTLIRPPGVKGKKMPET